MGPFDAFWLATAVRLTAPLLFASTGELVSERSGILNVGLEGMMLSGAFFGFLTSYLTGSTVLGLLGGGLAGMSVAAVMAVLAINARADQVIVGIGLNILALGVTTFVFREVFAGPQVILERPGMVRIPLLADIPGIGSALFAQPLLVYLAFLNVPVVWFVLNKTSIGLAMRAAGEVPEAVDAAGSSAAGVRWFGTLTAGLLAGFGGAFLSLELGIFVEAMSSGKGFLALAAVIFGRWRPGGVLAACVLFGSADALQLRLQAESSVPVEVWVVLALVGPALVVVALSRRRRISAAGWVAAATGSAVFAALTVIQPDATLPNQLWRAMPFVVSLVALGGFAGRSRMPTALAVPYRRSSA
jgi:simple sugar transport system permease protein